MGKGEKEKNKIAFEFFENLPIGKILELKTKAENIKFLAGADEIKGLETTIKILKELIEEKREEGSTT